MSLRDRIRRKQCIQQAEGYLELGMADHALAALATLEAAESLGGHACYLRGEALRELERYEEGLEWLRQAADASPDNIHIWLALGWCYKRIGTIDMAIESLDRALAVDPSEAIIHYNLACYWSLARNPGQALGYLAQALEIDTNYRDLVHDESDFDAIREHPGFQALTTVIV